MENPPKSLADAEGQIPDLRTTSGALKFLDERIRQARLDPEWQQWRAVFQLDDAPQAIFGIASNGMDAFQLVDAWTQETRHAQLAQLIVEVVGEYQLTTLGTPRQHTSQGAPVGGQYQDNPLRGGFSVVKAHRAKILAPPLALLFLALVKDSAAVPASRVDSISGAAHNNSTPEWAAFLALCEPPANPRSWADTIEWAASFQRSIKGSDRKQRATEKRFIQNIQHLGADQKGTYAFRARQKPQSTAHRVQAVRLGPDPKEPEIGPETAVRNIEWAVVPTRESVAEADEPDALQIAIAPEIDPQEPELPEGAQQSGCIRTAFRSAIDNQRLRYHWDALLPEESAALVRAVEADLPSPEPAAAISSLVAALALCLAKRPRQVWDVPISDGTFPGLDPQHGTYIKEIPRPPASWTPEPDRPCRLLPSADTIVLPLPQSVAVAMRRHLGQARPAQTVAQTLALGTQARVEMLRAWFAGARDGTYRLAPRRIARTLEIQAYAQTGRAVLAYWIAGTSEDPPPSGAYYIAGNASDVQQQYVRAIEAIWSGAGINPRLVRPSPTTHAYVGTRLIPPADEIRRLPVHLLGQLPPLGDLRDWSAVRGFHNRYTAFCVSLMLYATAHRPVNDPLDGHPAVSAELGYALVDDKNLGQSRSVRLVPLCDTACSQMQLYLAHLRGLVPLISREHPALRRDLESQLAHASAQILPLFFFIDAAGEWQSVTPTRLLAHYPPGWPYPDNLHRHLLATWFYQEGIDEEASAQMLGHVDVGTASLSLTSPHALGPLFGPLKSSIDRFLTHCGWAPQPGLPPPTQYGAPSRSAALRKASQVFGAAQRAIEREQLEEADRTDVSRLIEQRLAGRPESVLTQDDARHLMDSVNAQSSNRSTRRALLRLDALRSRLLEIRRKHKLKLPVPKMRRIIAHEPSLFTLASLANTRAARELRAAFLSRLDSMRFQLSAQEHPHERGAHALFTLVAFARVLDPKVLEGVLTGRPFWIVDAAESGFFLELRVGPKNIRRFPVGAIVVGLMADSCFSAENKPGILRQFERLVAALTGQDKRRNRASLQHLIEVFLDEARLELPGILVGYLSGEAGAVSLPRQAWLRYLTDKAPIQERLPRLEEGDEEVGDELSSGTDDENMRSPSDVADMAPRSAPAHSRALALDFVGAVDAAMSRLWNVHTDRAGQSRAKNNAPVQPLADIVEWEMEKRTREGALPPIGYLLGSWLVHLCRKGSRRGAVVATTISTYWTTLKTPLVELAHGTPLPDLVGTALQEIYSQVLDQTEYERPHLVLRRLMLFHWFLQDEFGVAEVDWTEVIPEDFPTDDLVVDAGIITWGEYRNALTLLEQDPHTPELRDRLLNCVCLMFLMRFGTRIGEATGIRRKDLIGDVPQILLRICNDDFRRVKTDAAVRHVPLLGELDEMERSVLSRWLEHIDWCHDDDHLAGLFSERDSGRFLVAQWRIAARISDALVAVTGDANARAHYGRHGLASRLMLAFATDSQAAGTRDNAQGLAMGFTSEGIRAKLMDRTELSRRGMWAAASVIGHSHPGTTLRYYSHLHDLLLAQIPTAVREPSLTGQQLMNVLAIDERALKRRANAGTENPSSMDIVRLVVKPARVGELVMERAPAVLPPPKSLTERRDSLNLEAVTRILQAADPSARLENIANRLLYDPTAIERALAEALKVCGDTAYGQGPSSQPNTLLPDPGDLSKNEWKRLVQVVTQAQANFNSNPGLLAEAGKIWIRGYAPSNQMLLLQTEGELDMLAQVFNLLGLVSAQWEVRVDPTTVDQEWCQKIVAHTKRMGVQAFTSERLPLFPSAGRLRAQQRRRVAIVLRESATGLLRNMKVAHRLFMAVAVTAKVVG